MTYKDIYTSLKNTDLHLSLSHVTKIINGEVRPHPRTWYNLCEVLNIPHDKYATALCLGQQAYVKLQRSHKNVSI